jgi:hypothetical protein
MAVAMSVCVRAGLGMLFARSALNPTGWTKAQLRSTIQQLKDRYPEMPGVGFYGASVSLSTLDRGGLVSREFCLSSSSCFISPSESASACHALYLCTAGHPPGNASQTKFVVNISDTATLDLIRYASTLSKEMFPDLP